MLRYIAALALAFLASPASVAAQPTRAPSVVEGADARIWEGATDGGTITHRQSGVAFPEAFGELRRFRVASVGSDGSDVALNYRRDRDGRQTVVTVYLFRPGSLPEHRLAPAVAAIGARSPEAFLWSSGPFLTALNPDLRAHKMAFKTGIGPDTVMDYLYFAPLGRWTVKVRATVASPTDIANEREVDALVRALPWAEILRANGACEGRACRANGAYPVDHHHLEMLLPGLDNAAAIYTQGDYRLITLPDPLIGIFEEAFGLMSVRAPLHAVERRRDGRWRTERLFSGLPTEAEFRAAVENLTRHPERSPFIRVAEVAEALPEEMR